ncbi:Ubiquitin-conjugating enzyme E2 T [Orchesella cincta]|uniref:Ubiquitin-conjugating enzyme E2 T n=1 Tax=Orchesella cincta TaxID=48709 RepID=A0A1D2M687_ORCCI|nr:Ubiquitin-conjugating enzyme E2 T [Orchesella cincta]
MSAQRLTRLKAEMAMMAKNPVPGIHCWLKEDSSDVISVEMDGPEGSPYESGVFSLEVVLSDRYPFTPPTVRFVTPVYHPNIDPNGRVCLSALKPKPTGTWAVNLNIATVLGAIRILLSEPNLSDPLMTEIAKEYSEKFESYVSAARAQTLQHAKKTALNKKEHQPDAKKQKLH